LKKRNYVVQTILTDGDFDDEDAIKKCIKESQLFPVSWVFVGVGNRDFTKLEAFTQNANNVSVITLNKSECTLLLKDIPKHIMKHFT